ncbi:MAG: alkaline phosphatase family protein [Verrucomicrobia bacterium]|nr:MAG: alkaline phosphatase family protein [Verrucomicrobiota bacterium]
MKRLAVINVVGLTEPLIGQHTPGIAEFLKRGAKASIVPAFPALTSSAQSDYLTGKLPSEHGIVANGWYNRELAEVQFTCAKLFWWFNMYSSADYSITPRPMYPADGRKVFDIYTWPYSIRTEIKTDLGEFPFPCFWGPAAGVDTPRGAADAASRWIAESAKWIENKYQPTLSLIYLPHLDCNLQRYGPTVAQTSLSAGSGDLPVARETGSPSNPQAGKPALRPINPAIHRDLRQIDALVGDLISFFQSRSVQVLLLSEYGITNVDTPIHLNRLLREKGWLTVKDELSLELLDCGASRVFAVADHQVAHIYLNDHSLENKVRELLERTPGVAGLMGAQGKKQMGLNHPRAGDLIAVAAEHAWFTYYYWLDDAKAPDFARTVDIHRKPGYDPVELFLDPKIPAVKLRVLWRLLQKRLGFRMLMDVIPLDATLVKGSHGCRPASTSDWPILISNQPSAVATPQIESTEVYQIIRRLVCGEDSVPFLP